MAYKVLAQDISAPFSHMAFFTMANQSAKAEKLLGIKVKPALQEITQGNVAWCLEENNFLLQAKNVLKKLENRHFYDLVTQKSYTSFRDFHQMALKVRAINFSQLHNENIADVLDRFLKIWMEATTWGILTNHTDFHFGLLSQKVNLIVNNKIKKIGAATTSAEAFSTLTTPLKRSMAVGQEIGLLAILEKTQKTRKNFQSPEIAKKIKQHTKRYDWLQYGYIGPTILNEEYFIQILDGLQKQGVRATTKIQEIIKREQDTKLQQQKFKRLLRFSPLEWYWIRMAREIAYLKGLRKDITLIASRALFPLLSEIAQRFNLSFKQVIHMSMDEIFIALKTEVTPPIEILNKRITYCIVYYPHKKQKIYVGVQAKKLAQKIVQEKIDQKIKELHGATAFPGKAQGKARLIFSPSDITKMQQGDILVSPATNPNVMPAIVKAGAIVTDEGGITCHAAIVSRELKIPCVIGTKIATKILKDGDRVEVDAEKGIVKKL